MHPHQLPVKPKGGTYILSFDLRLLSRRSPSPFLPFHQHCHYCPHLCTTSCAFSHRHLQVRSQYPVNSITSASSFLEHSSPSTLIANALEGLHKEEECCARKRRRKSATQERGGGGGGEGGPHEEEWISRDGGDGQWTLEAAIVVVLLSKRKCKEEEEAMALEGRKRGSGGGEGGGGQGGSFYRDSSQDPLPGKGEDIAPTLPPPNPPSSLIPLRSITKVRWTHNSRTL